MLSYWLDNDRVVILRSGNGVIVVNPFTAEITELDFSSPKFSASQPVTNFFLDPSLDRVVFYRNILTEFASLMLWDVQAKRELWRAEIGDQLWYLQPQWSPDGTQFVVGIPPALYDPVFELFVLDREGKRTLLTHWKNDNRRGKERSLNHDGLKPDGISLFG